ncbi:MAG: hypothetical protein H8D56_21680 [Planctomycetes bacterium]|nr:hypothetical protein [Planctomycetota bacterium]MBL7143214.1 hypothetical protein [Phycisphaerae bacterium]
MKTIHSNISHKNIDNKNKNRAQIDLLRSRLYLLDKDDKLLMTVYLENGNNTFQISRLTGLSRKSIARRINVLTMRLLDGRYINCLRNRRKFNKHQMAVAKDYFLTGLSIKKIALKRNRSRYHVTETIKKIKNILKECE